jgi:cytochrome c-type biogenesis protein
MLVIIPTQIFFDAEGKEFFRHEGFYGKEEISEHPAQPLPPRQHPADRGLHRRPGQITTRRAFALSSAFAGGILVTIAVIGVVTASLGRMAGDVGGFGNYLVAAIFFVVGLHLLDVIPLSFSGAAPGKVKQRGILAALVLGLVFGIALGPCTFAFMAPILAVTFKVSATSPLYGAGLLIAYGVGHCAVIVAAGTSAEAVQRYLNWSSDSRGTAILKKVCGVLVLLGGLYLLHTAR